MIVNSHKTFQVKILHFSADIILKILIFIYFTEKNNEQHELKKEKYKKLIKDQRITKEEKEQILAKRVSLERAIQYDGESYIEFEKIVCSEDINIVGIREKVNISCIHYYESSILSNQVYYKLITRHFFMNFLTFCQYSYEMDTNFLD